MEWKEEKFKYNFDTILKGSADWCNIFILYNMYVEKLYHEGISYVWQFWKEILLRSRKRPSHVWEPMTTRLIENVLSWRSGNVLIGGAYFGDHALIAAQILHQSNSSYRVICVEPNAEQRELLDMNANLNDLQENIFLEEGNSLIIIL